MDGFCYIVDNNEKFEDNFDEFEASTIDEWKKKWEPKKHKDRRGRTRDYGYVTYKVLNESTHFPDSKFEDKALTIALRQWGLRTKEIRFKRIRSGTADIEMKFVKKEDDKFFRDRPSTLAYAYF